MSQTSKLKDSRASWRDKAKKRSKEIADLKKANRKLKLVKEHQKLRADAAELKLKQLESSAMINSIKNKQELIFLSLQLFLEAHIGFRAVSRVLNILAPHLGLPFLPCPQTVINWVSRLSIARIRDARNLLGSAVPGDLFSNGMIWLIDASIGHGTGKILSVLALKVDHHISRSAPSLKDVHCIGVSVAETWNGESVAAFLSELIAIMGRPAALLKDGGSDLGKAARLLTERKMPCRVIDDISHVVANLFKHSYGEHPQFDSFLEACGKISKNIKQTILACLAPPEISIKARFMNLHRLVNWASKIREQVLPSELLKGSATLRRLKAGIEQMPACQEFVDGFLRDAQILLECQKILKNSGLCAATVESCQKILKGIPEDSRVRIGFSDWLDKHLALAGDLDLKNCGLPISSDQIESLFSLAKRHGVGEIKDANRIALHIPALCGALTPEDARRVLSVSVAQQQEIEDPLPSLTKQRRLVLSHPEKIDGLIHPQKVKNLELIPKPRLMEGSPNNPVILVNCTKSIGPQKSASNEFQNEDFPAKKSPYAER